MSGKALHWAASVPDLSGDERIVLLGLAHRHNADRGDDDVWPSVASLASWAGIGRRRVMAAMVQLGNRQIVVDTGRRAGPTGRVKIWSLAVADTVPPQHHSKPETVPLRHHSDHANGAATAPLRLINGAAADVKRCRERQVMVPPRHTEPVKEPRKEPAAVSRNSARDAAMVPLQHHLPGLVDRRAAAADLRAAYARTGYPACRTLAAEHGLRMEDLLSLIASGGERPELSDDAMAALWQSAIVLR